MFEHNEQTAFLSSITDGFYTLGRDRVKFIAKRVTAAFSRFGRPRIGSSHLIYYVEKGTSAVSLLYACTEASVLALRENGRPSLFETGLRAFTEMDVRV